MSRARYLRAAFALVVVAAFGLVASFTSVLAARTTTHVDGSGPIPASVHQLTVNYESHSTILPNASAGNPASFDVNWGNLAGDWVLDLANAPTTAGEPAFVSATELDSSGNEHVGAARITVNNVAVTSNAITVWVTVHWSSPLPIRLHYLAI